MAWFHDTLKDAQTEAEKQLKKQVQNQNWNKVFTILQEHVNVEKHEEKGLSRASLMINQYIKDLYDLHEYVSDISKNEKEITRTNSEMRIKFKSAITSANQFEKILLRLIKESKLK